MTSPATPGDRRAQKPSTRGLALFLSLSLGFHLVGFFLLSRRKPPQRTSHDRPLEMVIFDQEKPKVSPPNPPKKTPIKVASVPKLPPDRPKLLPPPPNQAPPPESPTRKPAPLVVGLTLSSTTTAGSFAAPVGNTLYGKAAAQAQPPEKVKTYNAPKYVPIYQVDSEPSLLSEVKIPYPEQARKLGIEGTVTLSITVDSGGKVAQVKVLTGPGYGLDQAAKEAIARFKFRPATKNGESVETEMKYAYTFLLD